MEKGLFARWVATLPIQGELQTESYLSAEMVEQVKSQMSDLVVKNMTRVLARAALLRGQAPVSASMTQHWDGRGNLREVISLKTVFDPSLEGYIEALELANYQARRCLAEPWWKLVWWRIRGKLPSMIEVWRVE